MLATRFRPERQDGRPMVRETAAKFRREAPNSHVVLLEKTGHYLFREREDEVLLTMEKFYASIR